MSYTIDENGDVFVGDTRVFATISGGYLSCMIRAKDKATFEAAGLQVGLMTHENPAQPEVLDEEGNVLRAATEASGAIIPTGGNTVTQMGGYVTAPGVFNGEAEVTPPVIDTRWHVNFWIPVDSAWEDWIMQWMDNGVPVQANKNENALKHQDIEVIDPKTVATRGNVLL
jgi:hypothetical protein